jgi:hypothetical protein
MKFCTPSGRHGSDGLPENAALSTIAWSSGIFHALAGFSCYW